MTETRADQVAKDIADNICDLADRVSGSLDRIMISAGCLQDILALRLKPLLDTAPSSEHCAINGCVHKEHGCPTWPAGSNPFKPEPQTTPTHDEAVRRVPDLTDWLTAKAVISGPIERAMLNTAASTLHILASAPAPASGGVDAVALEPLDLDEIKQRILGTLDDYQELGPEEGESWQSWYCAAFDLASEKIAKLLASLSPAATPVSEAEPRLAKGCCSASSPCFHQKHDPTTICEACRNAGIRAEEALAKTASSPAFCERCDGTGFAYNQMDERTEECPDCEARVTAASSPAGGDMALVRAVKRAMDNAGTLPAKESVKLVPADWCRVCDLVLGASQPTSAGRGTDDAS